MLTALLVLLLVLGTTGARANSTPGLVEQWYLKDVVSVADFWASFWNRGEEGLAHLCAKEGPGTAAAAHHRRGRACCCLTRRPCVLPWAAWPGGAARPGGTGER
jgi:hypothetical protein